MAAVFHADLFRMSVVSVPSHGNAGFLGSLLLLVGEVPF
jgi:hypothetical protein